MANYLNPKLFVKGVDDLKDRYVGWVLLGDPVGDEFSAEADDYNEKQVKFSEGKLNFKDYNIGGLMLPKKIGFDKNGELSLGFKLGNNFSNINEAVDGDSELTYASTADGVNSSDVVFFVKDFGSNSSAIFPLGANKNSSDTNYIDLSSGKIALVVYKSGVIIAEGNSLEQNEFFNDSNSIVNQLKSHYNNGTYNTAGGDTLFTSVAIEDTLFYYDLGSVTERKCNEWNYTGFTVGDIEVTISGFIN